MYKAVFLIHSVKNITRMADLTFNSTKPLIVKQL
jgi:hypothetical protein